MQLLIENDGPEIKSTNFWQTEMARMGKFYLSANAEAFRLLVPASRVIEIEEFKTAKDIILTRGFWPDSGTDAMEILFDDGSDSPYSLHLSEGQLDRLPSKEDIGRIFVFSAWTNHGGEPFCAFKSECLYRVAERLPYLKPKGE